MITPLNKSKVAIIMLNWRSSEDTIECLESLYRINYPSYDVLVIDNNSMDNSIQNIIDYCKGMKPVISDRVKDNPNNKPIKYIQYTKIEAESGGVEKKEYEIKDVPSNKKLIIIENDNNYGFPEGNNVGIRYALKKDYAYILLLNNDVVVDKDFLSELVTVMERDPDVAMAGSKIYDYYRPNKIQCAGGVINLSRGTIKEVLDTTDCKEYDQILERDCVWATSALFRRDTFLKIGELDPFFFFGIEEYDYCVRIKKSGKKVMYVGTSHIWHKKGASAKKIDKDNSVKDKILSQRGFLYRKHFYRLYQKHLSSPTFIVPYAYFMFKRMCYLSYRKIQRHITT